MDLINYYEILGIRPGCSTNEIKRSFRKKAKKLHPDLISSTLVQATAGIGADDKFRDLIDAYEVLSNPQKRKDYDRVFPFGTRKEFNYREFLRSQPDDLFSQAKLMFHDLLNSKYDDALELYEELFADDHDLELFLGYEDTMDCLFLLAEALEERGDFIRSCRLYKDLYIQELERPYFHHFIAEVIERLRNLSCFKMVSCLPPEIAIDYIQDLIAFDFSGNDNAFFYKKIAEIYCSLGEKNIAKRYLQKGLALDRKLPGVKKLKEKIGFSEIPAGSCYT